MTFHLSWLALSIVTATGCNRSGLNLAGAEGVVTVDGKPIAEAGVIFSPVDVANGPPATGTTDADGRFTLMTAREEGAVIGEHRVSLAKSTAQYVQGAGRNFSFKVTYYIPAKYESFDTSGLTATVSDDEDKNQFEFKLTSK